MPQELMWRKGTSWTALPVDTFLTVGAFCRSLLEREQLREELRREKFDIAIVDILYNECSLALAHDLGEDARTLLVCITVSFFLFPANVSAINPIATGFTNNVIYSLASNLNCTARYQM